MILVINLPSELLVRCIEELTVSPIRHERPAVNLLNLARTCKRLAEIVIPILYRSFKLDTFGRYDDYVLAAYVRSLVTHSHLRHHIRNVDLHNFSFSAQHGIWQRIALETHGLIWSPDTLGTYLCQQAPNLRVLDIEYPPGSTFLNFSSQSIEVLRVRPNFDSWKNLEPQTLQSDRYPIDGMLSLDFVEHVLTWPRLRELQVEATTTFPGDFQPRQGNQIDNIYCGNLSRIVLRLGMLDLRTVTMLIQRSTALKEFIYIPPTSEDTPDEWDLGSVAEDLPEFAMLTVALQSYAPTLEKLVMSRAGSFWDINSDTIGPLTEFKALKYLQIDVAMLVGWDHCSHILSGYHRLDGQTPLFLPSTLGSLLPTSLEHLVLLTEMGTGTDLQRIIATFAVSLAADVKAGQLPNLRNLQIQTSKSAYCQQCRQSGTHQNMRSLNSESTIFKDELRAAAQTLDQLGTVLRLLF